MSDVLDDAIDRIISRINAQVKYTESEIQKRLPEAVNELRNSELIILRGQRSGRRYAVPGTGRKTKKGKRVRMAHYKASVAGEAPAARTGIFRESWQEKPVLYDGEKYVGGLYIPEGKKYKKEIDPKETEINDVAMYLEYGTPRMAPRPYVERILEHALPKVKRIFGRSYKME